MQHDFDAIFYVKNPPRIVFEDGTFHVSYDVGKRAWFEFVLPPHVYLKALRAGNLAADQFHEEQGDVVPIRGRRGQH